MKMIWIHQIGDRNDWLCLAKAVLNLPAPYEAGNFFCCSTTIIT
jgi:hypothetical protein